MQYFKTISFTEGDTKTLTISFNDKEVALYNTLNPLSSNDLRTLIGVSSIREIAEMAEMEQRTISQQAKFLASKAISQKGIQASEVTFKAGKNEPFQRWYPYIEGYSPSFVSTLIENYNLHDITIYEPFAGTGTTIFASDIKGLSCLYSEINPLLRLLISSKIAVQSLSPEQRKNLADQITSTFEKIKSSLSDIDRELENSYIKVFGSSKYFSEEVKLIILQYSYAIKKSSNCLLQDLLMLAVATILVPISFLKKQGDLRFKTKKELETEVKNINDVLPLKIAEMAEDINNLSYSLHASHRCLTPNAKLVANVDGPKIGAVITSPPYLNGTNYIRNTKLELWFLGFLKTEKDLRALRDDILTSGINDVKTVYKDSFTICKKSEILTNVITELNEKAYDKRIPLMAVCYFNEMFQVFSGLQTKLIDGAKVLIDLGDSIFCNVHIPTDKILIEILEGIGYKLESNSVLRTRRSRNGSILSQFLIALTYKPC